MHEHIADKRFIKYITGKNCSEMNNIPYSDEQRSM